MNKLKGLTKAQAEMLLKGLHSISVNSWVDCKASKEVQTKQFKDRQEDRRYLCTQLEQIIAHTN